MTSKSSFWVNLKSNLRRRVWLAIIMELYFFFALPVYTAMSLSMEKKYYIIGNVGQKLTSTFKNQMTLGAGLAFFTALLALGAAIQGFSYMYQRKKLDLYQSVPVSRQKRFWAIYLNGILIYLACYLVNLILTFVVAQAMGADSFAAIGAALVTYMCNIVFYVAMYHIGILAVMLTGNLIVTCLASGTLLFYDLFCIGLLGTYSNSFFNSYTWKTSEQLNQFLISPVSHYINMTNAGVMYLLGEKVMLPGMLLPYLLKIAGIAVVTGLLAYWCYGRKPSEACGQSIAFAKIKGILKILLIVPLALGVGIVFYQLSGENMAMFLFGLVTGIFLGHCVMEVVYDFDIRSVRHGLKSLMISAAACAGIFCIFKFDLIGYDRFVPGENSVESAAFVFDDVYMTYYDENLEPVANRDYQLENMNLTDISAVREIAARRMGNTADDGRRCIVRYNMKDGREVYRAMSVDYREDEALLNSIVGSEEYQKASSPAYSPGFLSHTQEFDIYYSDGAVKEELKQMDIQMLLDSYREDLKQSNFTTSVTELVVGELQFEHLTKDKYMATVDMPVYPSFTRTVALLKQAGVYKEAYIRAEDVVKLVVTNSNYSLYKEKEEAGEPVVYQEYTRTEEFTDPEEIAKIAEAVYPSDYVEYWLPEDIVDTDYSVVAYYQVGDKKYIFNNRDGYSHNYYMLAGKIPEFVKEKCKY